MQARNLYHSIGTPSIADLKAAIHMITVINSLVTTADVDLAKKNLDQTLQQSKAKQCDGMQVTSYVIEILKELIAAQQDVTLCIDGMKVNGLWSQITISRNIPNRTAQFEMKKEATEYLEAIKEIIATYNQAGLCVAKILSDNKFRPLEESL